MRNLAAWIMLLIFVVLNGLVWIGILPPTSYGCLFEREPCVGKPR